MTKTDNSTKEKFLRESGALNTHPVSDPLFMDSDFFDPKDLVQVKYEMLRKIHQENQSISHAASSFGFSRQALYKIQANFEQEGIHGLLPRKRGPRGGHKLTAAILTFIEECYDEEPPVGTTSLLKEVEKRFGVRVHRRSLERARLHCKKKRHRSRVKNGNGKKIP